MDDNRLNRLADAILDGEPVEWGVSESSDDADERALARELQIVAGIASVHRSGGQVDEAKPGLSTGLQHWAHLRLDAVLGRGSYGLVYRAWDPHLEREVALKLLRSAPRADDPSATLSDPARVVNEGRLLARIRHPHVITVYGADTRAGTVGIWMELVHGRTLHDIVLRQGPMSAREAAAVAVDLAGALAAVHGAGLLHRDVSARNVMREDGGRIVLMDFGAGHDYSRTPAADAAITGTPVYMAPELLNGGTPSASTDLYALGVLMFFLVTGRYPVTGRTLTDLRAADARRDRTRLRDARPDLPAAFVDVVERALAHDPSRRFATAGEFELELQRVSAAGTVTGARWRWNRHVAIATLLLVAVAGLLYALSQRAPTRAAPGELGEPGVAARRLNIPQGVSVLSNPSADGRYVAAMLNETGGAALLDLASGTVRALDVSYGGDDGYASLTSLSPDASRVAIDWHNAAKGTLIVAATDGSGFRVLLDRVQDAYPHEWSRDGNYILTHITEENGAEVIALVAASDGAVRVLGRIAGGRPERMSLSPDGRYVVYDVPESASPRDRDLMILDAHTGAQRSLVAAPGHDRSPLWAPDGRSVLFLSDRSRVLSAWVIDIQQGRPSGSPRLAKDDVGRVWLRGFTSDGRLYYALNAGYAEVYVGSIDTSSVTPITPRQAVSNFFPVWSTDGRYLAYTSERRPDSAAERDLWVYDTATNAERVVAGDRTFGRPLSWSPDSQRILMLGANTQELLVVDLQGGEVRQVADGIVAAYWLDQGIVTYAPPRVIVLDAVTFKPIRGYQSPTSAAGPGFTLGVDGRFTLDHGRDGILRLQSTTSAAAFDWRDVGISRVVRHGAAPDGGSVAYVAMTATSDAMVLKVWDGGEPRELMRVQSPERLVLAGWVGAGEVLAVHRKVTPSGPPTEPDSLWRLPTDGRAPIRTGLAMEALRDFSFHPDGRRWAFNAGFKRVEHWVLENLVP